MLVFSSKPWIPFEHHDSLDKPKLDFKADMWAYATTLWEIFSYGRSPMIEEVGSRINTNELYSLSMLMLFSVLQFSRAPESKRPRRPANCPENIHKIMKKGWNEKSEGPLSPQTLISELIKIREFL